MAFCRTSLSLWMGDESQQGGSGSQTGCRQQSELLGSRGANGECAQWEENSYAEGLATTDTSQLCCFVTCSKEIWTPERQQACYASVKLILLPVRQMPGSCRTLALPSPYQTFKIRFWPRLNHSRSLYLLLSCNCRSSRKEWKSLPSNTVLFRTSTCLAGWTDVTFGFLLPKLLTLPPAFQGLGQTHLVSLSLLFVRPHWLTLWEYMSHFLQGNPRIPGWKGSWVLRSGPGPNQGAVALLTCSPGQIWPGFLPDIAWG